mgnify:CR=1 FL=1
MIKRIRMAGERLLAFKGIGVVSQDDYVNDILPYLERCKKCGRKVKFLCLLGNEFKRLSIRAAWEDLKLTLNYINVFEKFAFVSGNSWVRGAVKLVGYVTPCEVKVYNITELKNAKRWVKA